MDRRVRLLYIDDDDQFVGLLADFLKRRRSTIDLTTATTARGGLDHVAENPVDCVVSAYRLPDLDGLTVLDRVRETRPDLPVILVAAEDNEGLASEAIAHGVTDFFRKELRDEQFDVLTHRISNAVQQYRATKRAVELERIRAVRRKVTRELVYAGTREEIERAVCSVMSDADPYRFAWIGEHNPDAQAVEPRAAAGVEDGYLDTVVITIDGGPTSRGPTGRAIRTRELAVMQDIPHNPEYEPWREDALERGYRSSAAVPLIYDDTLYGVLNVYADRIGAFDDQERELLSEVGADIAHAIYRAEIRTRQERSEQLIETLPIGVYRASPGSDGEILDANPALADIFGAESPQELVGRPVSDLYWNPEDRMALSARLQRVGLVENWAIRQQTLDAEEIWTSITAIQTRENGEVCFDGIVQDITERKEHERQLTVLDRVLRHNLHNDMTVIRGWAETIRDEADDELAAAARRIVEQSDRLLATADKQRAITEVVTKPIQRVAIDATSIVEELATSAREAHPDADIELDLLDEAVVSVTPGFDRAIAELIENAIVHNDRTTPEVAITITTLDKAVRIRIEDNGPGIPEAERTLLTGEQKIEPLYHGSGLGLWLVYWIVKRSNGKLLIETAEPHGSVVTIQLSFTASDQ